MGLDISGICISVKDMSQKAPIGKLSRNWSSKELVYQDRFIKDEMKSIKQEI